MTEAPAAASRTEAQAVLLGPRRACFVTFEGVEGCGKSTQISMLVDRLFRGGHVARATREPGGTPLGEAIRGILLASSGARIEPLAELLLYVADRAEHLLEVILPSLQQGVHVVCDRYLDATLAYQGYARGLGFETVLRFHQDEPLTLRPDRTILLDLDPAVALGRAVTRNRESGAEDREGRFEGEGLAFQHRVREGYLRIASMEPHRIRVVDGSGPPEAVAQAVWEAVEDLFPDEPPDPGQETVL